MNSFKHVPSVMRLVAIMLGVALPAQAATFNVDGSADDAAATACDDATPNDCSLRGRVLFVSADAVAEVRGSR